MPTRYDILRLDPDLQLQRGLYIYIWFVGSSGNETYPNQGPTNSMLVRLGQNWRRIEGCHRLGPRHYREKVGWAISIVEKKEPVKK